MDDKCPVCGKEYYWIDEGGRYQTESHLDCVRMMQDKLDMLAECSDEWMESCRQLAAEVERLKMVYEEAGKWIANLKAEVEKLRWMTKHFISYADAEHGQKEDEVCEYEDWEVADLARRWEEHGA